MKDELFISDHGICVYIAEDERASDGSGRRREIARTTSPRELARGWD